MAKKLLEGNKIERIDENTHRVKTKDGKEFHPGAKRLGLFKRGDGEWKSAEEWPSVAVTLICRMPGCHAEGVEIDARVGENVDGVYRAGCGCCGQPIEEMWVDEAYVPLPLDPDKVGGNK